jgi:hypothetical protein
MGIKNHSAAPPIVALALGLLFTPPVSIGIDATISAAALLNGDVTAASLKDRIVVIGVTVTGSGDVFPTPFDPVHHAFLWTPLDGMKDLYPLTGITGAELSVLDI